MSCSRTQHTDEPAATRSQVKHSTTEPLCSLQSKIEYGKYLILEGIYPRIGSHIVMLADSKNIIKRSYTEGIF